MATILGSRNWYFTHFQNRKSTNFELSIWSKEKQVAKIMFKCQNIIWKSKIHISGRVTFVITFPPVCCFPVIFIIAMLLIKFSHTYGIQYDIKFLFFVKICFSFLSNFSFSTSLTSISHSPTYHTSLIFQICFLSEKKQVFQEHLPHTHCIPRAEKTGTNCSGWGKPVWGKGFQKQIKESETPHSTFMVPTKILS